MTRTVKEGTIFTIPERCRKCYTCVRTCPAKAIRVVDGQAKVIDDRCIGCGNCVRVCSRKAKQVLDSTAYCKMLLSREEPVAAIVAPSAAAEFHEFDRKQFVGMLLKLGFDRVNEVAFGADLVAKKYRELLQHNATGQSYIATTCPAIINFVEHYHPSLLPSLAPLVSPMVATARVVREICGPDIKIVFIGPCTAKKCEGFDANLEGEVNCVLTFVELRQMFAESNIDPQSVEQVDFAPPWGGTGSLFPVGGGLLQAANITEDLISDDVIAINDRRHFVEALKSFEDGTLKTRLLEILACEGCIMGAGMSNDAASQFSRRHRIGRYTRKRLDKMDLPRWQEDIERFSKLDFSRKYQARDQRQENPDNEVIKMIMAEMGKFYKEDELNCGACGYDTCREHALAIFHNLAESEMCLPYTIGELEKAVGELEHSNKKLSNIQEALMHAERLASMGQLAAGIAHEINNPLGVILMYAHLMQDACQEGTRAKEDASVIASQADRCKKIVAGLLNFARENKVLKVPTDMNTLVNDSLKLVQIPYDVKVAVVKCENNPVAEVDGDQVIQVLTNIISNALAAMESDGMLEITVLGSEDKVKIAVKDNGKGIPKENMNRVFEPFFTTKQLGKGTGLGLAVTYGIVKMHSGDIKVESNADPTQGPTGTTFTVTLPRHANKDSSSNHFIS
ncbi:MAG: histidine kinase [Candidatus Riflebacteria bacterium HGW-Riflebacteria-1]|jgi:signal transduction histidine kinase/iron only hydrogenase large subunit-like protein|nr:MAG: histidine kinase [Candidatus Riflebacteria bacterium HGW-Riflebacteria-1]